jgi:ABC-type Zn uptake system ZnuABC Zn-binding protein ZnuA
VLTSFAPLYCFALNVAGEDAAVKPLLTSRGPHDYPYDPKDLMWLQKADLFLVNGLNLDDFATKLARNSGNRGLRLAKVGEAAVPKSDRPQLNVEHGDHVHSGDDPHVWVGLPEAQKMVDQIAAELSAIDPAHKANYERRAKEYKEKLEKIYQEGLKELSAFKPEEKRIVTTHDAFQYFARAMGVEIVGYIQPRAGHGIDSKDLKELVEKCKGKVVRVITTEPQFPSNDAQALLKEVSAKLTDQPKPVLAELDPLETANDADLNGGWFETKMAENIANLVKAFKQYAEQK